MYCQLSPQHLRGLILHWISRGGRKRIRLFIASQTIFEHSSLNNGSLRAPFNLTLTRRPFSPPRLWCQTQARRSSRCTGQNPPPHPHPSPDTAFPGRPPVPLPRPRRSAPRPPRLGSARLGTAPGATAAPHTGSSPPPRGYSHPRVPGRALPHRCPRRDTRGSRPAKGGSRFAKRAREGGDRCPEGSVPRGARGR